MRESEDGKCRAVSKCFTIGYSNKGRQDCAHPNSLFFKMDKLYQDVILLPTRLKCEGYFYGQGKIPLISASASKDKDGKIHISVVNLDPVKERNLLCEIRGVSLEKVPGEIITANKINAYNDFGKPEEVKIEPFKEFKIDENNIVVTLLPKSVVMLEVQ
ncbi:MAG: alpha-L-arabinofuranosidase C-terminal domain-containing protein [candidate division WOR-3 bacterium]